MANENQEQGIRVTGKCNGVDSYFDKHGVEKFELLIVIPNVKGILSIALGGIEQATKYKAGEAISMMVKPSFFNGRLSGLKA